MEILIKCIVVAVLTAISANLLKRYLPEVSLAILIIACAILLTAISGVLTEVFDFVISLAETAGISNEFLGPLIKVSAIAVLSKISCDFCREAGAGALVTAIELGTSAVAIVLSMPLFTAVLGLITGM